MSKVGGKGLQVERLSPTTKVSESHVLSVLLSDMLEDGRDGLSLNRAVDRARVVLTKFPVLNLAAPRETQQRPGSRRTGNRLRIGSNREGLKLVETGN